LWIENLAGGAVTMRHERSGAVGEHESPDVARWIDGNARSRP
jgi:hypothetical protein